MNEYESRSDEEIQEINTLEQNVTSSTKAVDYKSQFRSLKRKLKFLIYENEFFQDAMRSNQRRLLKVSRDRAFLLDRLLQYEKPENTSSESEDTDSSEEDNKDSNNRKAQESFRNTSQNESMRGRKKFKMETEADNLNSNLISSMNMETANNSTLSLGAELEIEDEPQGQGHMSAAEVERHLKSKKVMIDLLPERAPATVPTEMFSIDQTGERTQ